MTTAKQCLIEALNALLVEWQKINREEADSEAAVQLRRNIKKLLDLIETLEKGEAL